MKRWPLPGRAQPRYRLRMDAIDAIDFDTLDDRIAAERAALTRTLRQIADRLDALPVEDAIEALTGCVEQVRDVCAD